MRFESQFWRMNCQTFSTGFNSGDLGGSGRRVMLSGHDEPGGDVPACLVEDENGVRARRDRGADLDEMRLHRLGVGERHDESCALAELRTDGTEGEPCRAIGPSDNGERPTSCAGRAVPEVACRAEPSAA